MSKTPRTDKKEFKLYDESLSRPCSVVRSSFARQLETELSEARAEIENLRFMVHNQRCCRNCGNHASWQFDICGFGENPQDENEGPHCRRNDLKRWRPMEYRREKAALAAERIKKK